MLITKNLKLDCFKSISLKTLIFLHCNNLQKIDNCDDSKDGNDFDKHH